MPHPRDLPGKQAVPSMCRGEGQLPTESRPPGPRAGGDTDCLFTLLVSEPSACSRPAVRPGHGVLKARGAGQEGPAAGLPRGIAPLRLRGLQAHLGCPNHTRAEEGMARADGDQHRGLNQESCETSPRHAPGLSEPPPRCSHRTGSWCPLETQGISHGCDHVRTPRALLCLPAGALGQQLDPATSGALHVTSAPAYSTDAQGRKLPGQVVGGSPHLSSCSPTPLPQPALL